MLTKTFQMMGPSRKCRIIERARHRNIQVDDAVSILGSATAI